MKPSTIKRRQGRPYDPLASAVSDLKLKDMKEASEAQLPAADAIRKEAQQTQADVAESLDWMKTLIWTGSVLLLYTILQGVVTRSFIHNPEAREDLLSHIPISTYQHSAAAFFTAMSLNLISFIFEETADKRQLALLSAIIKGLSWHCDRLLLTGQSVVTYDAHGLLLLPNRYVQWMFTTPTILFVLSKISALTPLQICAAISADVVMIITGLLATLLPTPFNWFFWLISMGTFCYVMWMLKLMIDSAIKESADPRTKSGLLFTFFTSLVIWSLFPLAWLLPHISPRTVYFAELMLVFSNFAAKVVFSSCIMYNNFLSIAQRRMLASLAKEQAERIQMVADLRESISRKDNFLSIIGHELRTPLNAIIQLSNALARGTGGSLTDRGKGWIQTISDSGLHLLGIINDILLVGAMRAGSMPIKQEVVEINGVVDHVLHSLAPLAAKDVMIERAVADRLPPLVGDRSRIIQILSNLVGNSLKFTTKGKVSVRVYHDQGGRTVIIKVSDTGCGIPKEKLATVWDAFEQADMTVTRKYGGTGLGLNIVKQLVEAHDGEIRVESVVDQGTTFTCKLPVMQRDTRESLEVDFKNSYENSGFNYKNLMAHMSGDFDEKRGSGLGQRMSAQGDPRGSAQFDSQLTVEQFRWDGSDDASMEKPRDALESDLYKALPRNSVGSSIPPPAKKTLNTLTQSPVTSEGDLPAAPTRRQGSTSRYSNGDAQGAVVPGWLANQSGEEAEYTDGVPPDAAAASLVDLSGLRSALAGAESRLASKLDTSASSVAVLSATVGDVRSDQEACMMSLSKIAAGVHELLGASAQGGGSSDNLVGGQVDRSRLGPADIEALVALAAFVPKLQVTMECETDSNAEVVLAVKELQSESKRVAASVDQMISINGEDKSSTNGSESQRIMLELERLHCLQQQSNSSLAQLLAVGQARHQESMKALQAVGGGGAGSEKAVAMTPSRNVPDSIIPLASREGPGFKQSIAWSEVPSYGLQNLVRELNMKPILARMQAQGIHMWNLLDMPPDQLEAFGIRQQGARYALLSAVREFAKNLLKWSQERSDKVTGPALIQSVPNGGISGPAAPGSEVSDYTSSICAPGSVRPHPEDGDPYDSESRWPARGSAAPTPNRGVPPPYEGHAPGGGDRPDAVDSNNNIFVPARDPARHSRGGGDGMDTLGQEDVNLHVDNNGKVRAGGPARHGRGGGDGMDAVGQEDVYSPVDRNGMERVEGLAPNGRGGGDGMDAVGQVDEYSPHGHAPGHDGQPGDSRGSADPYNSGPSYSGDPPRGTGLAAAIVPPCYAPQQAPPPGHRQPARPMHASQDDNYQTPYAPMEQYETARRRGEPHPHYQSSSPVPSYPRSKEYMPPQHASRPHWQQPSPQYHPQQQPQQQLQQQGYVDLGEPKAQRRPSPMDAASYHAPEPKYNSLRESYGGGDGEDLGAGYDSACSSRKGGQSTNSMPAAPMPPTQSRYLNPGPQPSTDGSGYRYRKEESRPAGQYSTGSMRNDEDPNMYRR